MSHGDDKILTKVCKYNTCIETIITNEILDMNDMSDKWANIS